MVEIKPEDYQGGGYDWDTVVTAGYEVMAVVKDLAFHRIGDSWDPWAEQGDVPALVAEVRDIVGQLEEAIKKAKGEIASVERTARLAAIRREKAEARHG
jgi:hypothetical protein